MNAEGGAAVPVIVVLALLLPAGRILFCRPFMGWEARALDSGTAVLR